MKKKIEIDNNVKKKKGNR